MKEESMTPSSNSVYPYITEAQKHVDKHALALTHTRTQSMPGEVFIAKICDGWYLCVLPVTPATDLSMAISVDRKGRSR